MNATAPKTCPQCGQPIAPGLQGHCQECLALVGFGALMPAATPPGDASAALAQATLDTGTAAFGVPPSGGSAVAPAKAGAPNPTVRLTSPTEKPGDTIGRYKLLQKVGEGGCGVVYMAEQSEPVRRKVALKVIKLGMDTKSVIARFEAERQALAMMDHPNIAKVLDAGATDAGRPYFVMELVRGIPITKYCDENQLDTPARLGLFTAVCSAIQHAHQKGIIHRDIKPSNILVTLHDGVPVPKVIDFGIAKATEARLTELTLFTELNAFIGTPAYMSPEQAEMSGLDIDTRADVYSLGVLLYELLTGRLPFDAEKLIKAGLDELRRTIREVEPQRPSTRLSTLAGGDLTAIAKHRGTEAAKLSTLLRGDLDWIVMKALEKDRTRRYESASAFAQDINRHLGNEAVLARPPTAAYRFQKAYRRNKLAFAAAGAIAASLVIGIAVSVYQAVRAKAAQQHAVAETARATAAEKKTAETLAQVTAERDAKEMALKNAEDILKFLNQVFQSPDPARDGRTITVAETLEAATRKLDSDLTAQAAHRAMLQATIGNTYFVLGLDQAAIPLQERVRDFNLATYGPEHPNTLNALNDLANSFAGAGRKDEALKLREEVVALRRKVNGPTHPATLMAMNNLANSYAVAGRIDEAVKLREEVLPMLRKVSGPEHRDTLAAMTGLAVDYRKSGRLPEAIALQESALAIGRRVLPPNLYFHQPALWNMAELYEKTGRTNESIKLREELLTHRRRALGSGHTFTLDAMNRLAKAYRAQGELAKAEALEKESADTKTGSKK